VLDRKRCSARLYVCRTRLHRAPSGPGNRRWSTIFHRLGHGPTCVRRSRFHDCADLDKKQQLKGRAARAPGMAQSALDGNIPPRLLPALLAVLSPGPRLGGMPSKGKERSQRASRFCGSQMAVDGSFWEGLRSVSPCATRSTTNSLGWPKHWRTGPGNLARSRFVRAFEMASATCPSSTNPPRAVPLISLYTIYGVLQKSLMHLRRYARESGSQL
jgi:hypothetical protein